MVLMFVMGFEHLHHDVMTAAVPDISTKQE